MKSNKKTSKHLRTMLVVCLICVIVLLAVSFKHIVIAMDLDAIIMERVYSKTTDLSDYGTYTGTADDEYVQAFIDSFFPSQIEPFFEDVTFVYCVEGADTYGFEAYLEFKINDIDEFENYIKNIGYAGDWQEFSFDPGFMECEIRDGFTLTSIDPDENDPYYNIESASIKKVLYNIEEQRIIYWALGVYDGGFADTSYLNMFFDRFEIDPCLYEQQAYFPASELIDP